MIVFILFIGVSQYRSKLDCHTVCDEIYIKFKVTLILDNETAHATYFMIMHEELGIVIALTRSTKRLLDQIKTECVLN